MHCQPVTVIQFSVVQTQVSYTRAAIHIDSCIYDYGVYHFPAPCNCAKKPVAVSFKSCGLLCPWTCYPAMVTLIHMSNGIYNTCMHCTIDSDVHFDMECFVNWHNRPTQK